MLDHECEQICNNLPGTFECACHPGLRVDLDNVKKCIGEFFSYQNEVKKCWEFSNFEMKIFSQRFEVYLDLFFIPLSKIFDSTIQSRGGSKRKINKF